MVLFINLLLFRKVVKKFFNCEENLIFLSFFVKDRRYNNVFTRLTPVLNIETRFLNEKPYMYNILITPVLKSNSVSTLIHRSAWRQPIR